MSVTYQCEEISNKIENNINSARLEAHKSPCLHKHGCVITVNGKIISNGHNNYRTCFNDQFYCQDCSCHAEIHALRNLWYKFCRKKINNIKVV